MEEHSKDHWNCGGFWDQVSVVGEGSGSDVDCCCWWQMILVLGQQSAALLLLCLRIYRAAAVGRMRSGAAAWPQSLTQELGPAPLRHETSAQHYTHHITQHYTHHNTRLRHNHGGGPY